jgi:hypothetical protein
MPSSARATRAREIRKYQKWLGDSNDHRRRRGSARSAVARGPADRERRGGDLAAASQVDASVTRTHRPGGNAVGPG